MTAIPVIFNKISFDFGAVCLVSFQHSNRMFWGPLAMIVIPGFLIHCWTFVHIAKVQVVVNRNTASTTITPNSTMTGIVTAEMAKAVRIQWRALLLALVFLVTFFIYWMFFTTQSARSQDMLNQNLSQPEWLIDWFRCVYNNGGQDQCSALARPHVPSISFLIIAEAATSFIGINIFIIFGMQRDLWLEWGVFLARIFGPRDRLRNLPDRK